MIRNSTKLTAIAAVALLSGATALNCSKGSTTPSGEGDVKLAFSLPDGLTINLVNYQVVSSSSATLLQGSINTSDKNATVSLDFALPASTGDIIKLTATTTTGVSCTGQSTPFNIVSGGSTPVSLGLSCGNGSQSVAPGSVIVTANVSENDNCPSITSASVAPAQTSVGSTIAVAAMGTDPDAAESVVYAWGPAANFANPAAASTTYTCTVGGAQTITLTISDTHNPPCSTQLTFPVNCVGGPVCGNGVVEAGEQCDPPNGTTCSATCQTIASATGGTTGSTGGTTGAAGAPATGGTTGAAGAAATGGTTGAAGASATGGAGGAGGMSGGGTGGTTTVSACTMCEFTNAATSAKTHICTGASNNGGGTSTANFGCSSFTNPTDVANCNALVACLRGAACQAAIANATPDFGEANVGNDDPTPCLCGTASDSACLAATSWNGVCQAQYVAAAGGGANVLGAFFANTSPVGVANNLMTCDVDATCNTCFTGP